MVSVKLTQKSDSETVKKAAEARLEDTEEDEDA